MNTGDLALLISGFSLATAMLSFLWNILQKFIFVRPILQVTFGIMRIFNDGKWGRQICCLNVINMGPGPAIIQLCEIRAKGSKPWRPLHGYINPINGNVDTDSPKSIGPYSGGLPRKLDAGETYSFYFPYDKDVEMFKESLLKVGVRDTYNQFFWCSRRDAKRDVQKFKEDFER